MHCFFSSIHKLFKVYDNIQGNTGFTLLRFLVVFGLIDVLEIVY